MSTERFTRTPAFRIALWGGLSAGPVLALLWPIFVRLESGVWPASPIALTLAMFTLGTLTGLGAAFTVLLPALSLFKLRPGPRLRWVAAGVGAGVCLILVTLFGLFSDVERVGAQWPLGLLLTIVGALCGWLGALAVPAAHSVPRD
ncbi:MAG: hypothetical protein Q4G71_06810 [Pseudomonadota bacterium]|nr:hypothetical protein [Pseudomonadota bacterium]